MALLAAQLLSRPWFNEYLENRLAKWRQTGDDVRFYAATVAAVAQGTASLAPDPESGDLQQALPRTHEKWSERLWAVATP